MGLFRLRVELRKSVGVIESLKGRLSSTDKKLKSVLGLVWDTHKSLNM